MKVKFQPTHPLSLICLHLSFGPCSGWFCQPIAGKDRQVDENTKFNGLAVGDDQKPSYELCELPITSNMTGARVVLPIPQRKYRRSFAKKEIQQFICPLFMTIRTGN